MSWGPKQVYTCGTASGASTSSFIDLGTYGYRSLALNAVTMSTGALITVWGSDAATAASALTATFFPVMERVNTAPVQHQALTVATTTSGGWAVLDAPPHRFLKFITSDVVSGGVSFTVLAQG